MPTEVSKGDWNQIIKGLECRPKAPECVLWADLAACCGSAIMCRLHVSEAQLLHVLAMALWASCRLNSLEADTQTESRMQDGIDAYEGKREEAGLATGRSQRATPQSPREALQWGQPVPAVLFQAEMAKPSSPPCPVTRRPGRTGPWRMWVSAAEQTLREEAACWQGSGRSLPPCLPQAAPLPLHLCPFAGKMEILVIDPLWDNWGIICLACNTGC